MTVIVIRRPSWVWATTHTWCMMPRANKLFSLCLTASLAQWHSADPAPSCLAAADRGGHPHFCPARNCHPGVHGRHPTTGRLEVNWRCLEAPWSKQHGAGGAMRSDGAGGTESHKAAGLGREGQRLQPVDPPVWEVWAASLFLVLGVPCPCRSLQLVFWGYREPTRLWRRVPRWSQWEPVKSLLKSHGMHFKRMSVSPFCRNTHAHGSHYNPIMQQPALLASHVTLPAAQPVNVGVAHVMRQPPAATTSTRKSKQHQSVPRWVCLAPSAGAGRGVSEAEARTLNAALQCWRGWYSLTSVGQNGLFRGLQVMTLFVTGLFAASPLLYPGQNAGAER